MHKVYIIILNYNCPYDTIECLESVLKLHYNNYQIIVVDNSETQDSFLMFEEWARGAIDSIKTDFYNLVYPLEVKPISYVMLSEGNYINDLKTEKVIFVKSNNNNGFAAGNNIGLKYALSYAEDGSYCWLLNNDTVIKKDSLSQQIDYLKHNQARKIGILGSKLVNYYNPETIQAVGGRLNTRKVTGTHIGEGYPVKTDKDAFDTIDYPIGASMLVSIEFLKNVGILSEDYFLYYEELDWVYRSNKKGWITDWCENSIVYHKEGASAGTSTNIKKKSIFSDIEAFRSRKVFGDKYFKGSTWFTIYTFLIIINRIRKRQFKTAKAFIKIAKTGNK